MSTTHEARFTRSAWLGLRVPVGLRERPELFRIPNLSASVPASATGPYNPGSRTLAIGETLLANFVPWVFNEYVSRYKDITRISPTTWKNNIAAGLKWDDNHFHVNMLAHPYAGSLYYNAGRTNGYSFEKSFLFTLLGSAFWECCGESHQASPGDFLSTTIGGAALGEVLYRWTNQLLNRANGQGPHGSSSHKPPNGWWEVPAGIMNPERLLSRWTLGRFSSPNPLYDNPDFWALFAKVGIASTSQKVVAEVGYTYDDVIVLTRKSRPFAHFETAVELGFGGAKQPIGRVQARGNLWSKRYVTTVGACLIQQAAETAAAEAGVAGISALSNCSANYFNLVPFLGFDYINNNAYEFGGQSVGLAAFVTFGTYPGGNHFAATVDGHGFFGGVQSENAEFGQLHDPRSERDREYDFVVGPGYGAALIWKYQRLRLRGFYRVNGLNSVDGSSSNGYDTRHDVTLFGGTLRYQFLVPFGVGLEYRRYHRHSEFDDPSAVPTFRYQTESRLGIFLTLDRDRPLGLFVF